MPQPNKVEYEKYSSKWGFTVYFDNWSMTCSGYDSKSEAKAAFDKLKAEGKLG